MRLEFGGNLCVPHEILGTLSVLSVLKALGAHHMLVAHKVL